MVYLQLLLLCASFLLEPINCQDIYGVLDCKWTSNGMYYRGRVRYTEAHKFCKRWESTNCDDCHEGNRQRFPYAGLDENYCRTLASTDTRPWCYTEAKEDKNSPYYLYWDYCNIPDCTPEGMRGKRTTKLLRSQMKTQSNSSRSSDKPFVPRNRVCLADRRGRNYRGPYGYAMADNNLKHCMKWEDLVDAPIRPSIPRYNNSGLEGRTCRNPDNGDRPWCYISEKIEYEFCQLDGCENYVRADAGPGTGPSLKTERPDCGDKYKGTLAKTKSGHTCTHWSTVTNQNVNPRTYPRADLRENYCRNPDNAEYVWCYYRTYKYEYCNIPKCPEE